VWYSSDRRLPGHFCGASKPSGTMRGDYSNCQEIGRGCILPPPGLGMDPYQTRRMDDAQNNTVLHRNHGARCNCSAYQCPGRSWSPAGRSRGLAARIHTHQHDKSSRERDSRSGVLRADIRCRGYQIRDHRIGPWPRKYLGQTRGW